MKRIDAYSVCTRVYVQYEKKEKKEKKKRLKLHIIWESKTIYLTGQKYHKIISFVSVLKKIRARYAPASWEV